MKIKNEEWLKFKEKLLSIIATLEGECDKIDFHNEYDNFELYVNGQSVNPVFTKKTETLRVEYDLSMCDTKIRHLAFSLFRDTGRIEITLKNKENNS